MSQCLWAFIHILDLVLFAYSVDSLHISAQLQLYLNLIVENDQVTKIISPPNSPPLELTKGINQVDEQD